MGKALTSPKDDKAQTITGNYRNMYKTAPNTECDYYAQMWEKAMRK
uniref:Uncharacterized protein n=1 Tax=Anguilla anguilla TaxID=7936 RepID=A0A0E9P7X4_ANGAN